MKTKEKKGITLIALVVTIVILIILATISVRIVLNSSLIDRAQKGAELTEIVKLEEKANMIYADKRIEKIENNEKNPVTEKELIEELNKEGYKSYQLKDDNDVIIDIQLDKSEVNMQTDSVELINVDLISGKGQEIYYIVLNNKYFHIFIENGKVYVSREGDASKPGTDRPKLEISKNSNICDISLNDNSIECKSKKENGQVIITVKLGHLEKKCIVNVVVPVSSLSNLEIGNTFFEYEAPGRGRKNGKSYACSL